MQSIPGVHGEDLGGQGWSRCPANDITQGTATWVYWVRSFCRVSSGLGLISSRLLSSQPSYRILDTNLVKGMNFISVGGEWEGVRGKLLPSSFPGANQLPSWAGRWLLNTVTISAETWSQGGLCRRQQGLTLGSQNLSSQEMHLFKSLDQPVGLLGILLGIFLRRTRKAELEGVTQTTIERP